MPCIEKRETFIKSVIAVHPGHLEILDTSVPRLGPYQALVRTECACLCNRTDSELLHGTFPAWKTSFRSPWDMSA